MSENKSKAPPTYVEMMGAEVVQETEKGVQFSFGDALFWAPKSQSKTIEDLFYVTQWLATQNKKEWGGDFVQGSKRTRMHAVEPVPAASMEEITELLREGMALFREALAKLRTM